VMKILSRLVEFKILINMGLVHLMRSVDLGVKRLVKLLLAI
jgi:hypothetical protein